ncbi:hypothetical protein [Undibacterium curvum]|uniref:hypothetical protein n=1 Tax=Undibacterium curvum TaxID=2762294 RepID=UPI003D110F73
MDTLAVTIDSWIIQDGNYGDFAVGDRAKFALEFAGSTLRHSKSTETVARHLGHGVYEVCAQVLFVDAKAWVIDFGFRAYWEATPPEFAVPGAWVEGELLVGIDPFFYMEYLHKLPGMPNLIYNWHVASIMRNDTPWLVEVNAHGGQMLSRDGKKEAWTGIARTDAWHDDEGRSSYVLSVERRDV